MLIIKRTVDDVGVSYYSSSYSDMDRFALIVEHFYANEAYLLDADQASSTYRSLLYLKAAVYLFKIPNVVANKLFDKPLAPNVPLDEYGNPAPIDVEPWDGFLIDHAAEVNVLADYCSTPPPTPSILIPGPLPSPPDYIYYQSNYNLLGQNIPHLSTYIFFNTADGKYYADQNPFSLLVPDGYYDSPNETFGTLHKYYHIVNGSVTQILNIIVDPNGPVGP